MGTISLPLMTEKFTISYAGSNLETAFTLSRGTKWSIRRIEVYSANAAAGGFVQVFRKNTASTAAEQDVTDSGSVNVLIGEFYYDAASTFKAVDLGDFTDLSNLGLRVRVASFGSITHTIYVNVTYAYTIA